MTILFCITRRWIELSVSINHGYHKEKSNIPFWDYKFNDCSLLTCNVVAAHGAGIDYADYSSEEDSGASKKLNQQRTLHQSSSIIQQTANARPEEMPYQVTHLTYLLAYQISFIIEFSISL